jgi:transcriptional regulator with XRE-family HTH domain
MTQTQPPSGLGAVMQRCRIARGLSQKEVATALGYATSQVVSDWERGIRSPPGPVYRKLVKLYQVAPQVFYEAILEERTLILQKKLKKMLGVSGA